MRLCPTMRHRPKAIYIARQVVNQRSIWRSRGRLSGHVTALPVARDRTPFRFVALVSQAKRNTREFMHRRFFFVDVEGRMNSRSALLCFSGNTIFWLSFFLVVGLCLLACLSLYVCLYISVFLYLSLYVAVSLFLSSFVTVDLGLSLTLSHSLTLSFYLCLSPYYSLCICLSVCLSVCLCLSPCHFLSVVACLSPCFSVSFYLPLSLSP